jgi:regulatory associated protein of mTOR
MRWSGGGLGSGISASGNPSLASGRHRRVHFDHRRFESNGKETEDFKSQLAKWRMKERMKTVGVVLVCCLNIGVDPPDVVRTSPCARMECWIDPTSEQPQKALEMIGNSLQSQYERWQPRARYKVCTDPTVDDIKKVCISMRRSSKDERVLFHYNGHGVPKPTNNGEIWVFNKNYTQYIPLSIFELQAWMESPSIYVFDCSAAGLILQWYTNFTEQRNREQEKANRPPTNLLQYSILLAACSANENLPTNPNFPADVFTACLTTPIKMALQWFCLMNVNRKIKPELIDRIPGKITDRRTVMGQLNWVFTTITDTIAWNVLPPALFQKLFRQDLLVASLFRNFLLADRVMRSAKCTPLSIPKLPNTANHPMWDSWDLAVDLILSHLANSKENVTSFPQLTFFEDQLTAFEVWLQFASDVRIKQNRIPEQLPVVLQVLLSQSHRLRALVLLATFLDLGIWAVNLALSVGIFPYVVKLLQSPSNELRQVLVFIWAKILSIDKSCQLDLVKDNCHNYFINVLSTSLTSVSPQTPQQNSHFMTNDHESVADDSTLAAFILSVICDNYRPGQVACLSCGLLPLCLSLIPDSPTLLRIWLVFCLGKLWEDFEDAKTAAIREGAHEKLCALLTDPCTEVRAAAVFSIGTFIANAGTSEARRNIELNIGLTLPVVTSDASPLVRKELVISLHHLVVGFKEKFHEAVSESHNEEIGRQGRSKGSKRYERSQESPIAVNRQLGSVYDCIWKVILGVCSDPFPEVAQLAQSIASDVLRSISSTPLQPSPTPTALSPQDTPTTWGRRGGAVPLRAKRNILGMARVEEEDSSPSDPFQQFADETKMGAQSFGNLLRRIGSDLTSIQPPQPPPAPPPSALLAPAPPSPRMPTPDHSSDDPNAPDSTKVNVHSSLFNWSCARFAAPLLLPIEEDMTSAGFLRRMWRNKRRKEVMNEATRLASRGSAACRRMDDQMAILDNNFEHTSQLIFHPYEDVLITANLNDQIGVWSLKEGVSGVRSALLSNGNMSGTTVTAMQLVNDHDQPLLCTASSDGMVRVWEHPSVANPADISVYVTGGKTNINTNIPLPYQSVLPKLVTAFKALTDLPSSVKTIGSNLNIIWQQEAGTLTVSGDVSMIRVWNLERELHFQDILLNPDVCVTCLANDNSTGRSIIAGYEDGYIRLFDQRTGVSRYTGGVSFQEQKTKILRVHRSTKDMVIAAGSIDGLMKLWDLRKNSQSIRTISCLKGQASAFAVHDYLPLFAVGSQSQKIKVFNFEGEVLSMLRYHDGFLGQRIGPISCLNFHPYKPYLAAGARDSIVSVYRGTSS